MKELFRLIPKPARLALAGIAAIAPSLACQPPEGVCVPPVEKGIIVPAARILDINAIPPEFTNDVIIEQIRGGNYIATFYQIGGGKPPQEIKLFYFKPADNKSKYGMVLSAKIDQKNIHVNEALPGWILKACAESKSPSVVTILQDIFQPSIQNIEGENPNQRVFVGYGHGEFLTTGFIQDEALARKFMEDALKKMEKFTTDPAGVYPHTK